MDKYDLLIEQCPLSLIFIYESNIFSKLMFEREWINDVIKNNILKCFFVTFVSGFLIFE